jgi:hypothetical protein
LAVSHSSASSWFVSQVRVCSTTRSMIAASMISPGVVAVAVDGETATLVVPAPPMFGVRVDAVVSVVGSMTVMPAASTARFRVEAVEIVSGTVTATDPDPDTVGSGVLAVVVDGGGATAAVPLPTAVNVGVDAWVFVDGTDTNNPATVKVGFGVDGDALDVWTESVAGAVGETLGPGVVAVGSLAGTTTDAPAD